jgi:hypothetical protein
MFFQGDLRKILEKSAKLPIQNGFFSKKHLECRHFASNLAQAPLLTDLRKLSDTMHV